MDFAMVNIDTELDNLVLWDFKVTNGILQVVDYNEAMLKETTAKKAKTTRRGGKKKATETVEAPAQETVAEETKAE